jgi:hypothetical protein
MLVGLTEAVNNNAVYMKNLQFKNEEIIREILKG